MTSRKKRGAAPRDAGLRALLLIFVLSGATGLVYQLVWVRLLTRVFGGTSLAVSTVLAAFMGGLALGSWLFGRRADRTSRPLLLYARLELGIALCALALPAGLALVQALLRALYGAGLTDPAALSLARAAGAAVLLLPPTTLMGGTLPALARAAAGRSEGLGGRLGLLYAANLLGAVGGAFAAGYLLIGSLGLARTTWLTAAVNLLIGLYAWRTGRRAAPAPEAGPAAASAAEPAGAAPSLSPAALRAVIAVYGLSGAAALALEVVWTRALVLSIGTTTYAFSAMLTVFLLGLFGGSVLMARRVDRLRHPAAVLAWTQAACGLAILATLGWFGKSPELFLGMFLRTGPDWTKVTAIQFALAGAALVPPALCFGAVFPLVARLYARELRSVGRRIGTAYAMNTLGAIAGAVLGGFLLLPALGIRGTTVACAAACLVSALALLFLAPEGRGRRRRASEAGVAAGAALLLAAALPDWEPALLSRGVYLYAQNYPDVAALRREAREANLLLYEETPEGTVSVEAAPGGLTMRVNGKADSSTGEDMASQALTAHLPLALHPDPREVLVIGLGSGITAGFAAQYPEASVRCAEISQGVIHAAALFHETNLGALSHPRVEVVRADARNLVFLDPRRYDCVLSEPSNIWIAGMGDLFSREFFRLLRSRLEPGGLVCQWVQIYRMPPESLRAILRTFRSVFPHLALFWGSRGDLLIVASPEPMTLDLARMRERLEIPEVRRSLELAGFHDAESVIGRLFMDSAGLERLVAGEATLVTDDNLHLEFGAARGLYRENFSDQLAALRGAARSPLSIAGAAALPESVRARIEQVGAARMLVVEAELAQAGGSMETAAGALERAYALAPGDPDVRQAYGSMLRATGSAALRERGDPQGALGPLGIAARIASGAQRALALKDLGLAWFQLGALDSTEAVWEQVLRLDANDKQFLASFATVKGYLGKVEEAQALCERVLELDPRHPSALQMLAYSLAAQGRDLPRALKLARESFELEPSDRSAMVLGQIQLMGGDPRSAVETLTPLAIRPGVEAEANLYLGEGYRMLGRDAEARHALERVVRADPGGGFAAQAEAALRELGAAP